MIRPTMVALIATSPLSVNLMALPTRLSSTCARRRSSPWPTGRFGATSPRQGELLSGCERLHGCNDRVDDVLERVVRKIERQLTGLDFGEVEHVIDQAEEMLAVGVQAFEHLAHLVRRLAVDVVENELGVAENGVERGAQLVAHVGEELRLVLARDLELPALLVDLRKQVGVLDRQHRLGGEGLEQIDRVLRERTGRFAAYDQHANHMVAPKQRNDEQSTESSADNDVLRRRRGVSQKILDLHRLAAGDSLVHNRFADAEVLRL